MFLNLQSNVIEKKVFGAIRTGIDRLVLVVNVSLVLVFVFRWPLQPARPYRAGLVQ